MTETKIQSGVLSADNQNTQLRKLQELGSRAHAIQVRDYVERPEATGELVEACRECGREACAFFGEVVDSCEVTQAADIAFIATLDLRHQLEALQLPNPNDPEFRRTSLARCAST